MSDDKSIILQLQNECDQLKRENKYLRKLLKFDPNEKLYIPKELMVEKIQTEKSINRNVTTTSNRLTPSEKITLLRSLFHGRTDVYAIRWENKNGRSGYSPACKNEWDRRFCRKPKIKCSECPNSEWLPVTDKLIHSHLTGKQMIGVYPLLKDETCHFLAIDFDKATWREDVLSFMKVCRLFSVPAILERSQSGNGAHIWIFFASAIPANIARALGTGLLTQTMQEQHGLSLDSYDRLFPNQDTLPKGGFGNLIALPLQGRRRKQGNSIFLDDELRPYLDPWSVLKKVIPMQEKEIYKLVDQLREKGGVLDVNFTHTEDDSNEPWSKPKPKTGYPIIAEQLPKKLEITKANLLYVPHRMLPAPLINQIKKIAAFQNPEFYRAQAMRLSTFGKPRVITCVEELPEYIGLPRGCESELLNLLDHYKIKAEICDKTQKGKAVKVEFSGELRPDQHKALNQLIQHQYGILSATTAFGKTVIAAKIIEKRKINTLVLVHRQQLLEQWRERLCSFLGLKTKDIGVLGGGRNKLTGNIDIAMLQSLSKQEDIDEILAGYGQVVVDECHHISAFSFEKVLKEVKAKFVLGLTATLTRKDGHHPIILMQCGPVRHSVSNKNFISQSEMIPKVHVRNTTFNLPNNEINATKMAEVYQALVNHSERNEQIFNDVLQALEQKRTPLLLTGRTQHLDWFADRFSKFVKNMFVLKGGIKQSKNTLFLTLPISWQGTLQQYVGRLHRFHKNKKDIYVYDYVDDQVSLLNRMFQKRLKKYNAMGYEIIYQ